MRNKQRSFLFGIIILIFIAGFSILTDSPLYKSRKVDQFKVTLNKCVDGDTAHFNLKGKDTVVRFLAIDTPETVKPNTPVQPYGKEASEFTCDHLKNAKAINLEYDRNASKDKYGRTLAWIFVDDQLLQKLLVKQGYARVAYLYDDYKYTPELEAVQKQAQKHHVGIWSDY